MRIVKHGHSNIIQCAQDEISSKRIERQRDYRACKEPVCHWFSDRRERRSDCGRPSGHNEGLSEPVRLAFHVKEKYHIDENGKQTTNEPQKDDVLDAKLAKLLDEKLKPFTDRITAEETKHEEAVRTANILASAKKAGIKEELAKMLNVPGDVTDLDSYMKDKAQQLANLGFSPSVEPAGGSSHEDNDGKAIAAQIRAGAPKK